MASQSQVKHYLALWFQAGQRALGKGAGGQHDSIQFCPQPVFQGHQYTPEFEQAWSQILKHPANFHLDGGSVLIADLLSNTWEIIPCGNCLMPVPASILGSKAEPCPCHALASWPNTELPMPRLPVNNQAHLRNLFQRLKQQAPQERAAL